MNNGIIEQISTPVEMYRYPSSRFVANFIGRANFVSAIVQKQVGSNLIVKIFGEVLELTNIQRDFHEQEAVSLIVRPEMLRINKTGEIFPGVIRRGVYLGDVIEYDVEVNGQMLTCVESDPYVMELFPNGEQVTVGFAEGCIQVLPEEETNS
jgi:iron(III) transport system ATP-binding protein